jgi:hypothetical protein
MSAGNRHRRPREQKYVPMAVPRPMPKPTTGRGGIPKIPYLDPAAEPHRIGRHGKTPNKYEPPERWQ